MSTFGTGDICAKSRNSEPGNGSRNLLRPISLNVQNGRTVVVMLDAGGPVWEDISKEAMKVTMLDPMLSPTPSVTPLHCCKLLFVVVVNAALGKYTKRSSTQVMTVSNQLEE